MSVDDSRRECHCVIHEPPADRTGWDDGDRRLLANVEGHGWGVFGIGAEDGLPGWAFTAGLWHTFGSPEVAMFGLRVPDMQAWLNAIGEQIRTGHTPETDERRVGILPAHPVTFRQVRKDWYRDLFGYAMWFAQQRPLPVLQVVWPDTEGRFPWDSGCGTRCWFDQPKLWLNKEEHPKGRWTRLSESRPWPFEDSPATRSFTTRGIADEGRPIVAVLHHDDGDWQFLDGVNVHDDVVVHLEHVIGAHPDVAELGDLARGWEAWRPGPDAPWIRRPSK